MQSKPINPNHKDMKKLTFLTLIVAIVLSLVSCKGLLKKLSKKSGKAKTEMAASPQDGEEAYTVPEEDVTDVFCTADLSLFELQGNVKSVKGSRKGNSYMDNWELSFDVDGRLTSIGFIGGEKYAISYASNPDGKVTSRGGHNVKRDNTGSILSVSAGDGCGDAPGFYFEYGKGGLSKYHYASGECTGDVYVEVKGYDGSGYIAKELSGWGDEYGSEETTTTYTITKTDEMGNWTERTAKIHMVLTEREDIEAEDVVTTENKTVTEKRTITYY